MRCVLSLGLVLCLVGCGLVTYPGQPGIKTSGVSKIDVEFVTDEGLYVYEARYDNGETGKGISQILTLAYPNALTFTSNVRTNADGSLYRTERQYLGAQVEMLVYPKKKEIQIPTGSKVALLLDSELSVDEVDSRNLSEESIFAPAPVPQPEPRPQPQPPTLRKGNLLELRWQLLRAARWSRTGHLHYQIEGIHLGDKTWTPLEALSFQTNLAQNGLQVTVSEASRKSFVEFVETNFPSGFSGPVGIKLHGVTQAVRLPVGIHTLNTVKAIGFKVKEVSSRELNQFLHRK